jgi:hypothetical protein
VLSELIDFTFFLLCKMFIKLTDKWGASKNELSGRIIFRTLRGSKIPVGYELHNDVNFLRLEGCSLAK